jgi:hypothetical protein
MKPQKNTKGYQTKKISLSRDVLRVGKYTYSKIKWHQGANDKKKKKTEQANSNKNPE